MKVKGLPEHPCSALKAHPCQQTQTTSLPLRISLTPVIPAVILDVTILVGAFANSCIIHP